MPTGIRAKDISGERFGRLVVECRAGSTSRGTPLQQCVCDCGERIKVTTGNLKGGSTRSCGCLRREHAKRIQSNAVLKIIKLGSLLRQLKGHYKQSADRRNIYFDLSDEKFEILVLGDCFYCGAKPNRIYRPTRYKNGYKSNGVDRKDNALGYTDENTVSCCKVCNRFKSDMAIGDMLVVVKNIYERYFENKQ